MRIAPQAVILDYGNVLSLPPTPEAVEGIAAVMNAPVELFLSSAWGHRLAYDKAELNPADYWNLVARECSCMVTSEQIERLVELDSQSWGRPNEAIVKWARAIREAGLRTAILSNMPAPMRDYLDRSCAWLPEFDQRTFSCDVRSAKPMPEIYAHCLKGLGIAPQDALFLDDRLENVQAAQEFGIHTILFTDAEEAGWELERRFSIPVRLRG